MPATTDMIVSGIFFGLMLGAIYSFYNKQVLGRFVVKLMEFGATTPAKAQSVAQAGHKNNYLLRAALRDGGMLRKVVYEDPERKGFFYVPDENFIRAVRIYGNKSATLITLIVTLVVLIAVMVLASFLLPSIIELVSSLFGLILPSSD